MVKAISNLFVLFNTIFVDSFKKFIRAFKRKNTNSKNIQIAYNKSILKIFLKSSVFSSYF